MTAADALNAFADAADEDIGRLLLRAFRSANARVVDRLNRLGHTEIRAPHTMVFGNLDVTGTRIVTLAHRADMTRQAMSALVRELETAGYVHTEDDPADGRAVLVTLTEVGVQFCLEAVVVVREVEAHWAELLGTEGLQQLRTALRALSAPLA